MKKAKKKAARSHAADELEELEDNEDNEDTMAEDDVETANAGPPEELAIAPMLAPSAGGLLGQQLSMRDPGANGLAAIRGTLAPASGFQNNTNYVIANLPPKAALVDGCIWVGTAFDAGGTLNISIDAADGTLVQILSADLSTVGRAPLTFGPKVAPMQTAPRRVIGAVSTGGGVSTVGCADVILVYA